MMKYLQKLGKALMLPVAVLPICGILMGLGYAFAPGVMGVPGAATSGAAYTVGFLLVKAGGALIDNMAWLFAIGAAVGLADDHDGTAGLAGLVSFREGFGNVILHHLEAVAHHSVRNPSHKTGVCLMHSQREGGNGRHQGLDKLFFETGHS